MPCSTWPRRGVGARPSTLTPARLRRLWRCGCTAQSGDTPCRTPLSTSPCSGCSGLACAWRWTGRRRGSRCRRHCRRRRWERRRSQPPPPFSVAWPIPAAASSASTRSWWTPSPSRWCGTGCDRRRCSTWATSAWSPPTTCRSCGAASACPTPTRSPLGCTYLQSALWGSAPAGSPIRKGCSPSVF